MDDNRLKIKVKNDPAEPTRQQRGLPRLLLVIGLFALLGGGLFIFFSGGQQNEGPEDAELAVENAEKLAVEEPLSVETAIADDGKTMWISPTEGEPLELDYLLPGTQLVLHVRVANLLRHAEGQKVFKALGPWGERIVEAMENITQFQGSEIDTLLVGIRQSGGGRLEYCLRLRLKQPSSAADLAQRLPASHELKTGEQTCYVQKGRAYFLPSQAGGQVLVVCPTTALSELIEAADEPPLFSRELQRVLKRTDSDRMVTLAFAGKFLQISGPKFLSGTGEPLREAVVDFLGDEATATAISLHWDDNFFLELQSTVALNQRPHRFATLLEKRLSTSSDQIEDTLLAAPLHPYGRKVLARFPAMLRKLGNYTRSAEEDGLTVLRCYLPITAGHNLALATELLLNTTRGGTISAQNATTSTAATSPQSLAERLQQSTSLVFPKETLQRALEMLSEDLDIPLEIAGRDLQLEGITKNQSFAMDLRDRPAAEVLLAILLQANPDRTVSDPTDSKQKLVYVIRTEADGQPDVIVVTTRTAAARRGENLPAVFSAPTR